MQYKRCTHTKLWSSSCPLPHCIGGPKNVELINLFATPIESACGKKKSFKHFSDGGKGARTHLFLSKTRHITSDGSLFSDARRVRDFDVRPVLRPVRPPIETASVSDLRLMTSEVSHSGLTPDDRCVLRKLSLVVSVKRVTSDAQGCTPKLRPGIKRERTDEPYTSVFVEPPGMVVAGGVSKEVH